MLEEVADDDDAGEESTDDVLAPLPSFVGRRSSGGASLSSLKGDSSQLSGKVARRSSGGNSSVLGSESSVLETPRGRDVTSSSGTTVSARRSSSMISVGGVDLDVGLQKAATILTTAATVTAATETGDLEQANRRESQHGDIAGKGDAVAYESLMAAPPPPFTALMPHGIGAVFSEEDEDLLCLQLEVGSKRIHSAVKRIKIGATTAISYQFYFMITTNESLQSLTLRCTRSVSDPSKRIIG